MRSGINVAGQLGGFLYSVFCLRPKIYNRISAGLFHAYSVYPRCRHSQPRRLSRVKTILGAISRTGYLRRPQKRPDRRRILGRRRSQFRVGRDVPSAHTPPRPGCSSDRCVARASRTHRCNIPGGVRPASLVAFGCVLDGRPHLRWRDPYNCCADEASHGRLNPPPN